MKALNKALLAIGTTGVGTSAGLFAAGVKGALIGTGVGGLAAGVALFLLGRPKSPSLTAAAAAPPAQLPIHLAGIGKMVGSVDPTKLPDGSPNPNKLPGETVAQYKARGGWAANIKRQQASRSMNQMAQALAASVTAAPLTAGLSQGGTPTGQPPMAKGSITFDVPGVGNVTAGGSVDIPGMGQVSIPNVPSVPSGIPGASDVQAAISGAISVGNGSGTTALPDSVSSAGVNVSL